MSNFLIPFIFGLPLALIAVGISLAGLFKKRHWFLVIGAALILPSSYYLSGGPGSYRLPLLLPLFLLGSAFAVYKNKMYFAWLLLIPVVLAIAFFVYLFIYAQSMQ
jgi:hypothetical protein